MSSSSAASADVFRVVLKRSSVNVPWGFRVCAGTDRNAPLYVFQVRRRGVAGRAGVKVNDALVAISGLPTTGLTAQHVLDLLSSPQLSLPLSLARSAPVRSASGTMMQQWSRPAAPTVQRTDRHATQDRPSSPGILAFIPFSGTTSPPVGAAVPQLTGGPWTADMSAHKSSYRAPPYRLYNSLEPRTKSYQPLDMTGKNSFYMAPMSPTQLPAREYAAGATPDRSDIGSTYSTQPSPSVSSPSDDRRVRGAAPHHHQHHHQQQQQQQRRQYVYDGDEFGDTPQSRSFLILEAALREQDSNAPPPWADFRSSKT